jgi:isoleucyl-tRNA synthetase
MRGDLVENEPKRLERWENEGLYQKIIARRRAQNAPEFILHDGPPFANGDVHMGTALNKLLKDLVVKSKTMAGFTAPFIPGWDCHGLPIEFKVVKEAAGLEPAEIRRRCAEFAGNSSTSSAVRSAASACSAIGMNPYLTMDPGYEADILRVFAKLVENGCVYQSKKPVQWSYGAQTALAEAEVEYKDKESPAIFVKFPVERGRPAPPKRLHRHLDHHALDAPRQPRPRRASGVHLCRRPFQNEIADREETLVLVRELIADFTQKTGFALSLRPLRKSRAASSKARSAASLPDRALEGHPRQLRHHRDRHRRGPHRPGPRRGRLRGRPAKRTRRAFAGR